MGDGGTAPRPASREDRGAIADAEVRCGGRWGGAAGARGRMRLGTVLRLQCERLLGCSTQARTAAMSGGLSTEPTPGGASKGFDTQGARGLLAGLAAFISWGVFPIFWRRLEFAGAFELVMHRAVWSFVVFAAAWLVLGGGRSDLAQVLRPRALGSLAVTATLIAINFLTFIYGVETDRVVEVSLGYFLNPILNILLGAWVLRERLSRSAWLATGLAGLGVAILASGGPALPWISLVLAGAFGCYGLVRKRSSLPPLAGNMVEMAMLSVPAGIGLWVLEAQGAGAWGRGSLSDMAWLMASGLVTSGPLFCFIFAARRLRLSTVGFLQYLAPSIQLVIAVWLFGEDFTLVHLVAFGAIWSALVWFAVIRTRELRGRACA